MVEIVNFCYRGILKGIEIFIKMHIAMTLISILLCITILFLISLYYLSTNFFAILSSLLAILS
jgi:hypothetical protein